MRPVLCRLHPDTDPFPPRIRKCRRRATRSSSLRHLALMLVLDRHRCIRTTRTTIISRVGVWRRGADKSLAISWKKRTRRLRKSNETSLIRSFNRRRLNGRLVCILGGHRASRLRLLLRRRPTRHSTRRPLRCVFYIASMLVPEIDVLYSLPIPTVGSRKSLCKSSSR